MLDTGWLESPVGWLEIKATDSAVVSILFYDKAPADRESSENIILKQCLKELKSYFDGTLKEFTVPIVHQGTPFQLKVWEELAKIPYGITISYAELSRRYGDIKAIRAVASANGKNKISIITPCQRVIGQDGSLTGYAGGLHRKKWLLEHEGAIAKTSQLEIF